MRAQGEAEISGVVVDEAGDPISGANITIVDLNYWQRFNMMISTDSSGRFYAAIRREGSYFVYATYDDEETPGVDYVPERWRTWLSRGSMSSHKFVLKKGASVYLNGEIRYIKSNKPAIYYLFEVLESIPTSTAEDSWTGPVRTYESDSQLVEVLGFGERLAIVPADTEVKISVTAEFPGESSLSRYYGQYSQTFTVTGKAGYLKIPQGEVLNVDIREYNILSNIEDVQSVLESGFSLLEDCWDAGFLVEAERRDLLNAYSSVDESLFLLKEKSYDQSFAKLRSAYILATRSEETLKGLIQTSSQASLPMLFIFVFIASASAYLLTERTTSLEILVRRKKFSFSVNTLTGTGLYFLLVALFYQLFPGCRLVHQLTFYLTAGSALVIGLAVPLVSPRLFLQEESETRSIRFKSAMIAAFSMGCRNLRRRKMRTTMNLINIMVLVFGFITLTSISPGFGLVARAVQSGLPVDALLARDEPLGGTPGAFISLPESFVDWLESQPNVTLVSPKAENTPVNSISPLGRLYSASGDWMTVQGILGIVPSAEAEITGLDSLIVKGNYLEDEDLRGILMGSALQEMLKVDVEDKVYGFEQEFIIRGFFDPNALAAQNDVDGKPIVPYAVEPMTDPFPCHGDRVIIVVYEKALTLPRVSTSRVTVQLKNPGDLDLLAKMITLTYEYEAYVSHPGSLTRQALGEYVEEQGAGLIPLLTILVMLNVGVSTLGTVKERRDEIASLSSIGLNPTHITALFVAEAMIIGFIGGGLGYLLGIGGYRLASSAVFGALQVREKVSAEWGIVALLLSGATAILASLVPALQSSTLITPSLLRKWRIGESEQPTGTGKPWEIELPVKLMSRELEPFTGFMLKRMREDEGATVDNIKLEEEVTDKGLLRKLSFIYSLPQQGDRSLNELVIKQVEAGHYDIVLFSVPAGAQAHARETVHRTATYLRKLIFEWNAVAFEVATPFDPSLSQLYTLVNAYNPTTLYMVSTHPDVEPKLEIFRNTLISKGMRPPRFVVSRADTSDVAQTMKTAEDVVSRADVICISGEPAALCSALAINAAKQKKTTCYVVDTRPPEERARDPFQNLKIVNVA